MMFKVEITKDQAQLVAHGLREIQQAQQKLQQVLQVLTVGRLPEKAMLVSVDCDAGSLNYVEHPTDLTTNSTTEVTSGD